MTVTREEFAKRLLDGIGAPSSKHNLHALISWMQAEGSQAKFNPLATTHPAQGATNFNSTGVKNYLTLEDGVGATIETLMYGAERDLYGYKPIYDRLHGDARPRRTLRAVEHSAWGTGGLAKRVLPYVKKDYDHFAQIAIAT